MTNNKRIFLVSGPSGSGKDTLINEARKRMPDLLFSVSQITRPMRKGETADGKYCFITAEEFSERLKNDEYLEYNEFLGNYYGTPKAPVLAAIENGYRMIIEVDVNGAKQIREKLPGCVSIFVTPPSYAVLEKRLRGRGTEDEEKLAGRLHEALGEIKRADEFSYIVVNDSLDTAVSDFVSILNGDKSAKRLKTEKQSKIIYEVLEKC